MTGACLMVHRSLSGLATIVDEVTISTVSMPMQINLHDAKTHLSRDVDQALAGEEVVRLVPLDTQPPPRRGGFLRDQAVLTADLKADFQEEIEAMFHGG